MNQRSLFAGAVVCALAVVPLFATSYVVPGDDVFILKSDAIVLVRAVGSHVDEAPDGVTLTTHQFAVERTLKGFVSPAIEIQTPGGTINGRGRVIGGVPVFTPGVEYLLFLQNRSDGGFRLTDFGLGVFSFHVTPGGRHTLQRGGEVFGWNLDGSPHHEIRRDADSFLDYIGAIGSGDAEAPAYEVRDLSFVTAPMATALAFTGTSYTSIQGSASGCDPAGCGARWNAFPVNWNQGNTESGAPGSPAGKTAITTAFASWNGSGAGISYVYATSNANTNGVLEAPDGVNNIVFEKNLSQYGAAYSCASGGLLGIGGPQSLSGTNTHNGEKYFSTSEADVSMNQGIANCTTLFSSGDFNTAVTHEIGHTLGLRHSDQTRADNPAIACSTDPSLDCSSSAIMRSVIPHSLSGALQAWDSSAVTAIYGTPAACTAPAISAQPAGSTITQGSSAGLNVTATGTTPFTYAWFAGNPPSTTTPAGTTQSINVSPNTTTSYWVRVTNSCGTADSNAATITVNPVQCNAPQVTTQPQNTSISFGAGAQLSVVASGSATLTYQWYAGVKGNTFNPVPNGTNATLSLTPTSTTQYWVRVTNSCGSADSNNATVTVNCASPVINAQPSNRTINSGSSAFLSVVASGGPNLTYQWYTGIQGDTSNPIPTGTTSSITVSPTTNTSYWVRVSVTGGCAPTDSQTATVTVNVNTSCPTVTITTPTVAQNGASYTLTTSASTSVGGGTVSITWYQQTPAGQTAIGTGNSIVVSPTATTLYLAVATNSCNSSNSAPVTVTIGGCAAPSVTQPDDQTIGLGSAPRIAVSASGGTLHYQWFQGLAGDTSHTVGTDSAILSPGPLFETSSFWVKVTNDCSTTATSSATITITVAPARRRSARH